MKKPKPAHAYICPALGIGLYTSHITLGLTFVSEKNSREHSIDFHGHMNDSVLRNRYGMSRPKETSFFYFINATEDDAPYLILKHDDLEELLIKDEMSIFKYAKPFIYRFEPKMPHQPPKRRKDEKVDAIYLAKAVMACEEVYRTTAKPRFMI